MSIIQEALKKIGNTSGASNSPEEAKAAAPFTKNVIDDKKPSGASKNILRPSFYAVVILAVMVFFGVRQFSGTGTAPNSEVNYSRVLESIYKPVTSANAAPAEPSHKTVAAKKNWTRFPDYVLSGVMQLVDGPRAIINDVMVGVGDVVNGAVVRKIDKDSVVLKKKDSVINLALE